MVEQAGWQAQLSSRWTRPGALYAHSGVRWPVGWRRMRAGAALLDTPMGKWSHRHATTHACAELPCLPPPPRVR